MHFTNLITKNQVEFWQEITAILNGTSLWHRPKDSFDFTRFVFPAANFSGVTFTRPAYFSEAIFGDADFSEATFAAEVHFGSARFGGGDFTRPAVFQEATFAQAADFRRATFSRDADFYQARFTQAADFGRATFTGAADFREATFTEAAHFRGATFAQAAHFHVARFTQAAHFGGGATFTQGAYFFGATFSQEASFSGAMFTQIAVFFEATFTQVADFRSATFAQAANFSYTHFAQRAEEKVVGAPPASHQSPAIADFKYARFEQPARVRFFQVNKESAQGLCVRFVNCNVEGVHFEDVHWHREGGRMVLQDELDIREGESKEHGLVAIAYRRLINNFEKVRAYDLAEDCFIGAMEMKRLNPAQPLFSRVVVTLYRWASYYGSSYRQAFAVLLLLLLGFGGAFALAGVEARHEAVSLPAVNPWIKASEDFLAGLLHSLEVATFQRDTMYVAANWVGRVVSMLETIFVPAQLALLLLALRRRFRR